MPESKAAAMAWEAAALGGSAAGSAGSVALAVARLQDPVMKVLYQEVDELEARLAFARRADRFESVELQ